MWLFAPVFPVGAGESSLILFGFGIAFDGSSFIVPLFSLIRRREIAEARKLIPISMTKKTGIGIVGCGNISGIYCQAGQKFDNIQVVACADLDLARAQSRAEEFQIPKACSVEDLLADPTVDIVVNLTIPAVHGTVAMKALDAGKSVYNEKPLTVAREDAEKLIAAARAKGLRVGCAPDTFLGSGLQTCRKLVDDGWIGTPVGASAFMLSHGPEAWHPDPEFFYKIGGGPMFDMGPYYLTALTSIIGPVKEISGATRISFPQRMIGSKPKFGQMMEVEIPTHVTGLLEFESGAIGTITTSFDSWGTKCPYIEIYGSAATLLLPDPNTFGGDVFIKRSGQKDWAQVPLAFPYAENSRGIGVADMAAAMESGRPHRASGEMALHVLDIMHTIHDAAKAGRRLALKSTMTRPDGFPIGLVPGKVE